MSGGVFVHEACVFVMSAFIPSYACLLLIAVLCVFLPACSVLAGNKCDLNWERQVKYDQGQALGMQSTAIVAYS